MLKVFASDALWRIVNDTLQVWGGAGFFTDQPFERMMRDARLNQIGEGANDVLRCFIAMVGLRGLGEQMQSVLKRPWTATKLIRFAPKVPVEVESLGPFARSLSKQIVRFVRASQSALIKHREAILDQQYVQARVGDMATELFMASCVYARLTSILADESLGDEQRERDVETGKLYLHLAFSRNEQRLRSLSANHDPQLNSVADQWLESLKT